MPHRSSPSLLRRLPLVALAATTVGCGPPSYAGPAQFARDAHGHAGELLLLHGSVAGGGGMYAPAPMPARAKEASCVDAALCETDIRDGVVVVGAKAPGRTEVWVQYEHPTSHVLEEARVPVSFGPARSRRTLEVGPRVEPGVDDLVLVAAPAAPSLLACQLTSLDPTLDAGHVTRGMTRAYACLEPVALPSGARYFGAAPRPKEGSIHQKIFHVCVHETTKGANPTALWLYEAGGTEAMAAKLVETRGDPKEVCAKKPR